LSRLKIIIIGGGAAGFFAAINIAEKNSQADIIILEKSAQILGKVKVSGGGRCNVTHACFEPRELVKFYPRGGKALLGAFTRFGTTDTINWFREKGVRLKTEADGRMFPVTDNSHTIIDCFLQQSKKHRIKILTEEGVVYLKRGNNQWTVTTSKGNIFVADSVVAACGSSSKMWGILEKTGHSIVPPVPSLFTFNATDFRIKDLQGVAVPDATVQIKNTAFMQSGALLITHWGFSGPAVLKLSAFAARELHRLNYDFNIIINWNKNFSLQQTVDYFNQCKKQSPRQKIISHHFPDIPSRLWQRLVNATINNSERTDTLNWSDISSKNLQALATQITNCEFHIKGKSTFKEEFVTAGGIQLSEVNFKSMESKLQPGLYFAGEILDIDAVTGGFNFQAAWTTAWLAAHAIADKV
jgi:predicted Rossmann fold flavoprotein